MHTGRDDPKGDPKQPWFSRSYIFEWLLYFVVLMVSWLVIGEMIQPGCSQISITSPRYQVKDELISDVMLIVILVPVSLLIVGIAALATSFRAKGLHFALRDFHCIALAILMSLSIAALFTYPTKVLVGRARPNFWNTPEIVALLEERPEEPPTNAVLCERSTKSSRRSYFSGHSSLSFSVYTVVVQYLMLRTKCFDRHCGRGYLTVPCLLPFALALLCSLSRITDNKHHPIDVTTGAMVGMLCGMLAFRQYYPSPTEGSGEEGPYNRLGSVKEGPLAPAVVHPRDHDV